MKNAIKPLYSPFKWICCFLLSVILPVAMYAPTYYDFTNILSFYMPFVGIVLFSDLALLEKASNTEEIAFIASKRSASILVVRFALTVCLMLLFIVIANAVYNIMLSINDPISMEEAITIEDNLIVSCASAMYIGVIAMTFSTILNNIYIGYGVSLIYWLFWNIKAIFPLFLNPFSLAAYPTLFKTQALILFGLSLSFVLMTYYFAKKSPFFFADKLRKVILK